MYHGPLSTSPLVKRREVLTKVGQEDRWSSGPDAANTSWLTGGGRRDPHRATGRRHLSESPPPPHQHQQQPADLQLQPLSYSQNAAAPAAPTPAPMPLLPQGMPAAPAPSQLAPPMMPPAMAGMSPSVASLAYPPMSTWAVPTPLQPALFAPPPPPPQAAPQQQYYQPYPPQANLYPLTPPAPSQPYLSAAAVPANSNPPPAAYNSAAAAAAAAAPPPQPEAAFMRRRASSSGARKYNGNAAADADGGGEDYFFRLGMGKGDEEGRRTKQRQATYRRELEEQMREREASVRRGGRLRGQQGVYHDDVDDGGGIGGGVGGRGRRGLGGGATSPGERTLRDDFSYSKLRVQRLSEEEVERKRHREEQARQLQHDLERQISERQRAKEQEARRRLESEERWNQKYGYGRQGGGGGGTAPQGAGSQRRLRTDEELAREHVAENQLHQQEAAAALQDPKFAPLRKVWHHQRPHREGESPPPFEHTVHHTDFDEHPVGAHTTGFADSGGGIDIAVPARRPPPPKPPPPQYVDEQVQVSEAARRPPPPPPEPLPPPVLAPIPVAEEAPPPPPPQPVHYTPPPPAAPTFTRAFKEIPTTKPTAEEARFIAQAERQRVLDSFIPLNTSPLRGASPGEDLLADLPERQPPLALAVAPHGAADEISKMSEKNRNRLKQLTQLSEKIEAPTCTRSETELLLLHFAGMSATSPTKATDGGVGGGSGTYQQPSWLSSSYPPSAATSPQKKGVAAAVRSGPPHAAYKGNGHSPTRMFTEELLPCKTSWVGANGTVTGEGGYEEELPTWLRDDADAEDEDEVDTKAPAGNGNANANADANGTNSRKSSATQETAKDGDSDDVGDADTVPQPGGLHSPREAPEGDDASEPQPAGQRQPSDADGGSAAAEAAELAAYAADAAVPGGLDAADLELLKVTYHVGADVVVQGRDGVARVVAHREEHFSVSYARSGLGGSGGGGGGGTEDDVLVDVVDVDPRLLLHAPPPENVEPATEASAVPVSLPAPTSSHPTPVPAEEDG